jgi:peptidoglycan/LPS O-acetylase OafA/YrhL
MTMIETQRAALTPEPAAPAVTTPAFHIVETVEPRSSGDNVAIGALRAFITVLVLAHHAVLAYHPFAPQPAASLTAGPRLWGAFPVVDSHRWPGFGLLVAFNDMFFMALMFFLSGLFVWASLQRKGSGAFLRDRAWRLGFPFVAAAVVIAPLAYYPAYLQTAATPSLAGFWRQWLALGNWPAGPAWFLWVLLAFDLAAAGLFWLAPSWGDRLGRLAAGARQRPALFFGLLVAASAVAYIPMELVFNPFVWFSFGPFFVQTSRVLHYTVYFLAGAGVGAWGLQNGLLAPDGKLARRWLLWSTAALIAFAVALGVILAALGARPPVPRSLEIAGALGFVLSCAASSFAFLALFVRFVKRRGPVFDSLRDNAFGMYLVHYAFVSWLQVALLPAQLSGLAKGSLVFLGTVLLSWGTTAALRRLPAVRRVI